MYTIHPNQVLNRAFFRKPFQGVEPTKAKYLFVGLDANYSQTVDKNRIFKYLIDYLEDGVSFWKTYGVHHPFLLSDYKKGDGWKYHHTFSKIGFQTEHADQVSFIELLHIPTCGRSKLKASDLDVEHLIFLQNAIVNGSARYIFISDGVARLMRNFPIFSWMPKQARDIGLPLKLWAEVENKRIYWHYHFSVYGKFERGKNEQLIEIGKIIGRRP